MGQKCGKAAYDPRTRPFVNLSAGAIETVWAAFNDVADGFGLSLVELQLICADLAAELELPPKVLEKQVEVLFSDLDSDQNGLIDSIEFVATLAVSSGMSLVEKLEFAFNCLDFDGAGALSVDELTLALRCTLMGLSKISGEVCPSEEDLEVVATRAFVQADPSGNKPETDALVGPLTKLRIVDAVGFCLSDPEASSWMAYFDDPDPLSSPSGEAPGNVDDDDEEVKFRLLYESIEYSPTQADEDYRQDNVRGLVAKSAAFGASAAGNAAVAVKEAEYWNKAEDEPWVASLRGLQPTALSKSVPDLSLPESSLKLEWVHGYRGEDCRGNVRYTASGEIVYPAACLGVVYSQAEHRQRHMTMHTTQVLSLAVFGSIVATGESGARPSVVCWDSATCAVLAVLKGDLSVAVSQLAFNKDGSKLVCVGADIGQTVVVYDWRNTRRVFSSRADFQPVSLGGLMKKQGGCLGVAFVGNDSASLCCVGETSPFAVFWRPEEEGLVVRRRGAFGRRTRRQPTLCVASNNNNFTLTGQASGHVYSWQGRNAVQSVKAHRGSVNCIQVSHRGVVTGGKDGKVRLWTHSLAPGATFDLADLGVKPTMRSVALSGDGAKILVGTGANEIYELSAADGSDALGGPATSTHFGDCARGLAAHPSKPEYATAGDDGTVRIFDLLTRAVVKVGHLDGSVRCVAYHPMGELIVVGLGELKVEKSSEARRRTKKYSADDNKEGSKEGSFCVLNEADLSVAFEAKDSALPLVACAFSPDGAILAVSSEDTVVYLYAVAEEYESIGQCRRHTRPVRSLDFSADSRWLRTCCDGGNLYFFNANSAQFQANVSALKDVKWATETALLGFGVQGAIKNFKTTDGAKLTAANRARAATDGEEGDGPEMGGGFLATADSYGRVRLQRWPAIREEALTLDYRGAHFGPVSKCVFNADETHLLTLGAEDRCLMQWTLTEDEREPEDADEIDEDDAPDYALELKDGADLKTTEQRTVALDYSTLDAPSSEKPWESDPWFVSMTAPTAPRQPSLSAPTAHLRLWRMFGYSCGSHRNNAKYVDGGRAVFYPCGSVVVRLELRSGRQTFGTAHCGREIAALAVSLDGSQCATSQVGGDRPLVCVWDALHDLDAPPQRTLRVPHGHATTLLAFSPSGKELASVAADEAHTLSVHDLRSGLLTMAVCTMKAKPLCVAFGGQGSELCLTGIKNILFFNFGGGQASSRHATLTRGRLGRQGGAMQAFPSCSYLPDGKAVVGAADGHLLVLNAETKQVEKAIKAHDDFVYALDNNLKAAAAACVLVSGSRDGNVKMWNVELECLLIFSNEGGGPVRSVCASPDGARLLVGSQASSMLAEFRASDGKKLRVVAGGGAAAGEQWALAAHPTEQRVATASDDGACVQWSLDEPDSTKARSRATLLPGPCRALAFSPDGKILAAALGGPQSSNARLAWARRRRDLGGTDEKKKGSPDGFNAQTDGIVQLLRADTGALMLEIAEARATLSALRFTADSLKLVAAGLDGTVRLFAADSSGQFSQKCSVSPGPGAALRTLDLSDGDSFYAMCVDESRSLQIVDLQAGLPVPDRASLRDQEWATWTAPLGWPTLAAHASLAAEYELEKTAEETEEDPRAELTLNCLARSNNGDLAATGDRHGRLALWRFPAWEPESSPGFKSPLHVGTLRGLCFTANDEHLVTLGGEDLTICVFKHERDARDHLASEEAVIEEDDDDGGRGMKRAVDAFSAVEKDRLAGAAALEARQRAETRGEDDAVALPSEEAEDVVPTPWVTALVPPANLQEEEEPLAPEAVFKLECAHGVRSEDVRNAAFYNARGNIVYPAAAMGVVYDARTHSQCFHFHHPNGASPSTASLSGAAALDCAEVSALAVSIDGRFAATGDQGVSPRVRVWDATTGVTLSVSPHHLKGGIGRLCFSQDGSQLAAIASDSTNTFALYSTQGSWTEMEKVASGAGCSTSKVHCAAFVGRSSYPLFVGSRDRCELIKPSACGTLRRLICAFDGKRCPPTTILCVVRRFQDETAASSSLVDDVEETARANENGTLVSAPRSDSDADAMALTGCSNGALYAWHGSKVAESVPKAHDGPIYALCVGRGVYASAGRDGLVKLWDAKLECTQKFRLAALCESIIISPVASSLAFGPGKLLIVTRSSEIIELATASSSVCLVQEGHAGSEKPAARESHGLDCHPQNPDLYCTSGDDGTLRVWSCSRRKCVGRAAPETLGGAAARCCAFSLPDGDRIAVGLGGDGNDRARDGTLVILRKRRESSACFSLEVAFEVRKAKAPLTDVKWARDGSCIVAACEDSRVYVHDGRDGTLRTVCAKAGSAVLGLDLSVDSKFVQIATAHSDLQFYSTADGARLTNPGTLRDEKWASLTIPLGWFVQGLWNGFGAVDVEPTELDAFEEAPRDLEYMKRLIPSKRRTPKVLTVHRSPRSRLLAKACVDGTLAIYNYPSHAPGMGSTRLAGHASAVAMVRFTCDGTRLIALGRFNRTVTQFTCFDFDGPV